MVEISVSFWDGIFQWLLLLVLGSVTLRIRLFVLPEKDFPDCNVDLGFFDHQSYGTPKRRSSGDV